MGKGERADKIIVANGLASNRTKARALIMSGKVFSGEKRIEKAGTLLSPDTPINIKGKDHPFVSRGGIKLRHAIQYFGIKPKGQICLDIGSSTGGFVDVLLRNNAKKVFSIDVGKGQLDWSLRTDERVEVLEGLNARYLTSDLIPNEVDIISCDASFIGLEKILPPALQLAADGCNLVALIKPQFQVKRSEVGKGGVVRDPQIHTRVCMEIREWVNSQKSWQVLGITESPITGPKGNKEFFLAAFFSK